MTYCAPVKATTQTWQWQSDSLSEWSFSSDLTFSLELLSFYNLLCCRWLCTWVVCRLGRIRILEVKLGGTKELLQKRTKKRGQKTQSVWLLPSLWLRQKSLVRSGRQLNSGHPWKHWRLFQDTGLQLEHNCSKCKHECMTSKRNDQNHVPYWDILPSKLSWVSDEHSPDFTWSWRNWIMENARRFVSVMFAWRMKPHKMYTWKRNDVSCYKSLKRKPRLHHQLCKEGSVISYDAYSFF